jgi:hypothetical protein
MTTALLILGGLILLAAVWLSVPRSTRRRGQIVKATRQNDQRKAQPRETFTTEEILLPGVDVRRPNARRQIEVSRELVAHGVTPAKYAAHVYGQVERNRRLDSGDVVDGEVVDAPALPEPRRRLRG